MSKRTAADTQIQVYLTYPGGELLKIGQPISLQRATDMTRMFRGVTSKCIGAGVAKLEYEVDAENLKKGKLVFEFPYDGFVAFKCDMCMGASVTLPLSAEHKIKCCREYIRNGFCKDPMMAMVVGAGLYPNRYTKRR